MSVLQTEATQAIKSAYLDLPPQEIRVLLTVRQFSEKHPAFSQGSLRNLIHLSSERYSSTGEIPGNGLGMALVRIGRKLLLDEAKFFQWIELQNQAGHK